MDNMTSLLGVLGALSLSVERIVEVIKGLVPWLSKKGEETLKGEAYRRAALHVLAIVSGFLIAFVSYDILRPILNPILGGNQSDTTSKIGVSIILGLMASGGSGFWNSSIRLVEEFKNAQKALAKKAAENK